MNNVEFSPVILTDTTDIFSIIVDNACDTEFQKFISRFKSIDDKYVKDDFNRIMIAIERIAQVGAVESFFRNEGKFSDRVCAIPLLIVPRNKAQCGTLRLYCIRVSDSLLVLGGGGLKSSTTYEDDPELNEKVALLQAIDKELRYLENEDYKLNDELFNIRLTINID